MSLATCCSVCCTGGFAAPLCCVSPCVAEWSAGVRRLTCAALSCALARHAGRRNSRVHAAVGFLAFHSQALCASNVTHPRAALSAAASTINRVNAELRMKRWRGAGVRGDRLLGHLQQGHARRGAHAHGAGRCAPAAVYLCLALLHLRRFVLSYLGASRERAILRNVQDGAHLAACAAATVCRLCPYKPRACHPICIKLD